MKTCKIFTPEGYLLQDILPICNNKVLINGAKMIEEGYKEHKFFMFEHDGYSEINPHDFGIIGVSMVMNGDNIFLISEKKCQVYSISKNFCMYIEEMRSIHVNPGCCVVNGNVMVIGGINNKTIEVYNTTTLH